MISTYHGSCHCGAVRFEADLDLSAGTGRCNCSICRRYGTLWSYYAPKDVRISAGQDETARYLWGKRHLEFHRCRHCGCVTHWASVDRSVERMGVNARLMAPEILAAARLRHTDGASW